MRDMRAYKMKNFISFFMVLISFENFEKIFLWRVLASIKNVPSRDDCPWQVTLRDPTLES